MVEFSEITIHGKLAKDLPNHTPYITEKIALDSSLTRIAATKYAWESQSWEAQIKNDLNDGEATYYPQAELIYSLVDPDKGVTSNNYTLAFSFQIKTLLPQEDLLQVFVDALTGHVVRVESLVEKSTGTLTTMYNGTKSFTTDNRPAYNDYVLKDLTRGDKIHTLGWSGESWFIVSSTDEIDDYDNVWGEQAHRSAATAHWSVQVAWDYFKNTHGRNGMDNAGGQIRVWGNGSYELKSTYYRENGYDYIKIGRKFPTSQFNDLVALDIVGHEFAHGINRAEGLLSAAGQAGALKESFADIFGQMVENSVTGHINDWTIGEDIKPYRSLSNPNTGYPDNDNIQSPDTYQGTHWSSSGITSINSGVQNFWFYLLANGGSGTNDNGQAYNVQGIGFDNAAKIAYRNWVTYAQSSWTYHDARSGSINAALDLFGECSLAYVSVMNAWYAVGLGAPAPGICVSLNPTYQSHCIQNMYFNSSVTVKKWPLDATVDWIVPDGWSYYSSGDILYYTINNPSLGGYSIGASVTYNGQGNFGWSTVEVIDCSNCPPGQNCNIQSADEDISLAGHTPGLPMYPNPATNAVTFEFVIPDRSPKTLSIFDSTGSLIHKSTILNEPELQLDLKHVPSGLYIVMFRQGGFHLIKKLLVTK